MSHIRLRHLSLEDKLLGAHKVSSKTPHKLVRPPTPVISTDLPPPEIAWEAFYPQGSINPSSSIPGGFSFYLSGSSDFSLSLNEGAQEALFSYRMMLQDGWEPAKGGKLPGIFGGEGDLSYHCSGGRQDDRCKCFNVRPMWRSKLEGELYTYLPITNSNNERLALVPPYSEQNRDYGFSVGRGAFDLCQAVGKWVSLAFRVRLNTVGKIDGKLLFCELELWVDGVSKIKIDRLTLRDSPKGKIKGMHFQTFFGGHSSEWASPNDQRAWFSDVTAAVLQD